MPIRTILTVLCFFSAFSHATDINIKNEAGEPLPRVMVTQTLVAKVVADLSDDGYAPHGVLTPADTTITRFTNADGFVSFESPDSAVQYRVRSQGYVDQIIRQEGSNATDTATLDVTMVPMTKEQYIASFPSNVWLSQLKLGGDKELKDSFELNCSFCHQQASPFMRNERTVEQWMAVFERMNSYGARLPGDEHQQIAELLQKEYRELRENPEVVPEPRTWEDHLSGIEMKEWVIGDGFSQMHDFLIHPNGYIYVGDNLFDRLYEIDPKSGQYTVYKVPHTDEQTAGGILGNRFVTFPKMHNFLGVHSFAVSPKDGNIFVTPSMQQALLEFNPATKEFTTHEMPGGYYPHTIRIDAQDRVWFTLALSSQVAKFDRTTNEFTLVDLPARGIQEWLILKSLPLVFAFDPANRPQPSPSRESIGLPMPYGIDVAPDGGIWATRLYANDIAHIDPETLEVTMVDFPFEGPRRLRVDADGMVWIVAFQDSLLVKYNPNTDVFTSYELPVVNEIPYALNVDKQRGIVWVNGNQSDTILSFDIANETWKVYPMPRQRFFTRDIEISEEDGAVYTTNSHFPTWQSEGGVPSLLRITPLPETPLPATPETTAPGATTPDTTLPQADADERQTPESLPEQASLN
ncbi:PE-PGRS family protein PE_PGRS18 [Halioglobus japonicus]|nr:PE-PGRS family protein PE_PGRS18 [Halioglobus japonicus]